MVYVTKSIILSLFIYQSAQEWYSLFHGIFSWGFFRIHLGGLITLNRIEITNHLKRLCLWNSNVDFISGTSPNDPMADSSSSKALPESWQVFINFRGKELRGNFISHLEGALSQAEIKYYIDTKETPSEDLSILFTRIEQSEIALCIFSSMYAESKWCLDELVKIMEQVGKDKLRIVPVFFNVTPEDVKEQKGEFGRKLYGEGRRKRPNIPDWENALQSVPSKIGLNLATCRYNSF